MEIEKIHSILNTPISRNMECRHRYTKFIPAS